MVDGQNESEADGQELGEFQKWEEKSSQKKKINIAHTPWPCMERGKISFLAQRVASNRELNFFLTCEIVIKLARYLNILFPTHSFTRMDITA